MKVEVDVIVTLGIKTGFTVIVVTVLVAGLPVTQFAFEVNTTVTMSPFANVVLLYVLLLVPTLEPFTFH